MPCHHSQRPGILGLMAAPCPHVARAILFFFFFSTNYVFNPYIKYQSGQQQNEKSADSKNIFLYNPDIFNT